MRDVVSGAVHVRVGLGGTYFGVSGMLYIGVLWVVVLSDHAIADQPVARCREAVLILIVKAYSANSHGLDFWRFAWSDFLLEIPESAMVEHVHHLPLW